MNHIKKKIFIILLLATCSTFCFGEQISFQIVEHNNSAEDVTNEALMLEDDLISEFFDDGYIVTNSLASLSTSDKKDRDLWKIGMSEALNGGSDYFVQIILHFTSKKDESSLKQIMILNKIDFSLALTDTANVKGQGSWNGELVVIDPADLYPVSEQLIDEIFKLINA